jgi:hypothetical protein
MDGRAGRIWSDLCAMESDDLRASMLTRLMTSPEFVGGLQRAGLYEPLWTWHSDWRRGVPTPFPWAARTEYVRVPVAAPAPAWSYTPPQPRAAPPPVTVQRDRIQHEGGGGGDLWQKAGRWSEAPPRLEVRDVRRPAAASSEMIVSPAAKALDYFEEALGTLGIRDSDGLTHDQLKAAYKRASLSAHPDKPGGSAAAFDALRRAYQYVEKILDRVKPRIGAEETARMSAPVTVESARKARAAAALPDAPKIQLSAKKLDMTVFNQLFEENRLPDPTRDSGYGDWLKSQGGDDAVAADPRLKGKFNQDVFESVFRERAGRGADAIVRRTEPDSLYAPGGTELGGDAKNFTAAMGSDTQFTDLKEAYTTGATVYQEIADVRVVERSATSVSEAKRMRDAAMARVDPDEGSRIAATAAALEERERQRKLRYAAEQTAAEEWDAMMRSRLAVTDRPAMPVQQSRRR